MYTVFKDSCINLLPFSFKSANLLFKFIIFPIQFSNSPFSSAILSVQINNPFR